MSISESIRKVNDAAEKHLRELRVLLDRAEEPLDKETYEQKRRTDFDAPDDMEVVITFGTLRKVEALINFLNQTM